MVLAPLVAEATDTPVWVLAGATFALVVATGLVAKAAFRALGQLKFAVVQLEEVRRDRHVQVFADFGVRWDAEAVAAALKMEARYSKSQLGKLAARSLASAGQNPIKKYRRRRAEKTLVILKRVPNYFEDLALVTQSGGLDIKLVSKNFKGLVIQEWELWEDAMSEYRKEDPWSYSQFEWLVRQVENLPDE